MHTITFFNHAPSRLLASLPVAVLMTLVLLAAMHTLVDTTDLDMPEVITFKPPEIVMPKRTLPTPRVAEPPIRPVEPAEQPAPLSFNTPITNRPTDFKNIWTPAGPTEIPQGNSAGGYGAIPLVNVPPEYPRRALQRGIQGYVDLIFDITASGQTTNIRVLAAEPADVFERAAIRALGKWKYQPPIEDGRPVSQRNITTRIRFSLE